VEAALALLAYSPRKLPRPASRNGTPDGDTSSRSRSSSSSGAGRSGASSGGVNVGAGGAFVGFPAAAAWASPPSPPTARPDVRCEPAAVM
jgi:hypothetical protein